MSLKFTEDVNPYESVCNRLIFCMMKSIVLRSTYHFPLGDPNYRCYKKKLFQNNNDQTRKNNTRLLKVSSYFTIWD